MIHGLRKKSLLLVEDNLGVQGAVKQIAEDVGFSVCCESDRRSAIDLIGNRFFDVAVFDKRLVENDEQNSDGMAVLKSILSLNEGTYTILLTGYGEFADACSVQDHGVRFIEKKASPLEMASVLYDELHRAINTSNIMREVIRSEALYFGNEDPAYMMDKALHMLSPKGGSSTLSKLLEVLMLTVLPVKTMSFSNNVVLSREKKAMSALFWSRGIGDAVVVSISNSSYIDVPDIPLADEWPQALKVNAVRYKIKEKNLYGSIVDCSGVCVGDFVGRER